MLEALVALADWDALPRSVRRAPSRMRSRSSGPRAIGRRGSLAAAGERAQAEELLRRALAGFADMGVVFEAALTKEQLAGVVVASDDASRLRAEALSAFRQLDAAPHVERVRAELSAV